jgi:hypothetical protein
LNGIAQKPSRAFAHQHFSENKQKLSEYRSLRQNQAFSRQQRTKILPQEWNDGVEFEMLVLSIASARKRFGSGRPKVSIRVAAVKRAVRRRQRTEILLWNKSAMSEIERQNISHKRSASFSRSRQKSEFWTRQNRVESSVVEHN